MPELPSFVKNHHSSIINKLEALSPFKSQTAARQASQDNNNDVGTVSSRSSSIARKPLPRKDDALSVSTATTKKLENDEMASLAGSNYSLPATIGRDRQSSQSSSVFSSESRHSKPSDVMLHLTESRLNELLEDMLDHMGLDETKRAAVRGMPKDAKWMMINQHMQQLDDSVSNTTTKGSPEMFARKLKDFAHLLQVSSSYHQQQSCCKTINAIKVSLSTQPIIWVKKFIVAQGLSYLLELLHRVANLKTKKDYDFTLELELVRCVKTLMNNKYGLRDIVEKAPGSVKILSKCLISESFPVKKAAAELLTVLCYTDAPTCHKYVWNALQEIIQGHDISDDSNRRLFELWLIKFLEIVESKDKIGAKGGLIAGVGWVGDNRVTDKEITEFLVSHTILINALVGIPEDLDYRINVRNRLHSYGFSVIIEKLQSFAAGNEFLRRQVEQYQLDLEKDWEILSCEFESIKCNEADPFVLVTHIVEMLKNSRGHQYFVSILQNLMCIRRDPSVRSAYLQLIDLVTSQIVFNGKGIDPDFSSVYPIDLGIIIDNFVHHDDVIRLSHENNLLKQMADQLLLERDLQKKIPDGQVLVGSYKDEMLVKRLKNHQTRLLDIFEYVSNHKPTIPIETRINIQSGETSSFANSTVLSSANESAENAKNNDTSKVKEPKSNSAVIIKEVAVKLPPNVPAPPLPPPPPPPMMNATAVLVKNTKKAPVYETKKKLRPLQFEKIPDQNLVDSFWKSCDDSWVSEKLSGSGVWKRLEDAFVDDRALGKTSSEKQAQMKTVLEDAASTKKFETNLIDAKKSYNITILLTKLKCTPQDLGYAILTMNPKTLTPSLVSQLLNYMPNAEEIGILAPYLDDDENLGLAERMLIQMIKIDKCILRLKSLHFKNLFEERFMDIETGIATLKKSSQCIYDSKKLQQFLQLVLAFGNVMNGKGFRGGAFGFKISSLNSLIYLRSNGGDSMLDFLLKLIVSEFPDLISIPDDLELIKGASRISCQSLTEDFNQVFKLCKDLHMEFGKAQLADGDLLFSFSEFVNRCQYRLEKCKKELELCVEQFQKTVSFYGDDPKDITSEDWFGGLKAFLMAFKNCATKISAPSRKSIDINPGFQAKDSMKTPEFNSASDLNNRTQEGKGVMDSLLDSLRNGTPMTSSDAIPAQQIRRPKKVQQLKLEDRTSRRISTDFARQASDLLGKLNGF